jgi:hypothetical protein
MPVILLLMMNCTAQENSKKYDLIEYKAQTRGSLLAIKVQDNELTYISNQNKGTHKLSAKEVVSLSEIIREIHLEKMNTLKAPSERRTTDGALHADFIITVGEEVYKSITFDEGNPPKELKKLEDLLYLLAKLKE